MESDHDRSGGDDDEQLEVLRELSAEESDRPPPLDDDNEIIVLASDEDENEEDGVAGEGGFIRENEEIEQVEIENNDNEEVPPTQNEDSNNEVANVVGGTRRSPLQRRVRVRRSTAYRSMTGIALSSIARSLSQSPSRRRPILPPRASRLQVMSSTDDDSNESSTQSQNVTAAAAASVRGEGVIAIAAEENDEEEDEVEFLEQSPPLPVPRAGGSGSSSQSQSLDSPIINILVDDEIEEGGNESGRERLRERRNENQDGAGTEEEEDNESKEPPQKMPRLDTTSTAEDEEGFICQICYEPFSNSGGHRVCCLKCGHIYGKECIERWIQTSKRCPSCNSKALKKDVRVLYVKNLKAMDRSELDKLKEEIDKIKIEKSRIELSNSTLRCKEEVRSKENQRLQQECNRLTMMNEALRRVMKNPPDPELIDLIDSPPIAGTSKSAAALLAASSAAAAGLKMPKLNLIKHFDIKEGSSRVGAFSEYNNLFVVSHAISNRLFPTGSYGIKKINTLEMRPFQSFPIHQKALRDMSFSALQSDLLLSVGLDKKAVLFNCTSNCAVQTFNLPNALWSCCWNTVSQNVFYVGSVNGIITSYDIRAPREPLGNLELPSTERTGVARMKFVSPAYQSQTFNMSGVIIQKLNSVWFAEMLGGTATTEPRCHQLPLEGPFLNVDFEENSRHVLVSTRPKGSGPLRTATTHDVCVLGKTYSTVEERDIFSCDIVQSYTGGFQESLNLCRSALFSPQPNQVYVAANGETNKSVRVWDIGNVEQKSLIKIQEDTAWDFIPGKINDTNFLGIVSQKSVDIYDVK